MVSSPPLPRVFMWSTSLGGGFPHAIQACSRRIARSAELTFLFGLGSSMIYSRQHGQDLQVVRAPSPRPHRDCCVPFLGAVTCWVHDADNAVLDNREIRTIRA